MPSLIELIDVTKTYATGARAVAALRSVTLTVAPGEFVCLAGRSGSGKSTLLNLLGGLDRADSGQVRIGGVELGQMNENMLARWRRINVGVVFQFFHLLPSLTALENVMFPMELGSIKGLPARRARAGELLAAVDLADCADAFPAELSGGQQQRVAIARALANEPPLLLADEPTGNLDSATGAAIINVLAQFAAKGHTLIFATHDATILARADRTLQLIDGRLAAPELQSHI